MLLLDVANAAAEPSIYGRPTRDTVRAVLTQSTERAAIQAGAEHGFPAQRHRDSAFGMPDGAAAVAMPGTNAQNSSGENARRAGRLSPEERRTLRRQIDEVGHDIYLPRR